MIDVTVLKAIRTAIKQGDLQEVVRLIGDDRERLVMDTAFGTWLHVAASIGQIAIVKWLVGKGMDVNAYGGTAGGGPLQRASSDGHLEVVKYLLECGADLDVSEPERNPLFGAIHGRHTAIAKLLIDRGIDIQVSYPVSKLRRRGALEFAREWGSQEIAALLKARLGHVSAEPTAGDRSSPSFPIPTQVDFSQVRQHIRDAGRQAFLELRAAVPVETLYAFALYSDDSAAFVNPSANSEEQLRETLLKAQSNPSPYDESPIFQRWNPFEWAYECEGADYFHTTYTLINIKDRYPENEAGSFVKFKGTLFAMMTLALKDLDAEGLFGTGDARNRMTVFCSVCDSGCALWLQLESARIINPEPIATAFWNEMLGEPFFRAEYDEHCRRGCDIHQAYLAALAR